MTETIYAEKVFALQAKISILQRDKDYLSQIVLEVDPGLRELFGLLGLQQTAEVDGPAEAINRANKLIAELQSKVEQQA